MAITATCSCGKRYNLKDELAGKRAKCNGCGQTFVIPKPEVVEDDIVELTAAPDQPPASPAPAPSGPLAPVTQLGLQPLSGDGIVSAGFANPQVAPAYTQYPGYGAVPSQTPGMPQVGYTQSGFSQGAYGQQGNMPQGGYYDPLAGQMGYPPGQQPNYFGAAPAKPAASSAKPIILGAVGVSVALVVGVITFVATQSLFKRPKPAPIVASTPAPVVSTPAPSPTAVPAPAKAPTPTPATPTTPAIPAPQPAAVPATPAAQPASAPPASWTATIDPAAANAPSVLAQPIGIELNPVDVERVTLTSPAINKVVLGSRKENKGRLLIYDLAAGRKLTDWESPKYGPAIQITSLSPSGEYFAFSTATQETEVWSLKDNKQLAAFKAVQGADGLTSFVSMQDSGRLLTGSTSGTLALWQFPEPKKVWNKEKLGQFGFNILGTQMAISPNHKFLALFRDGKCEVLDVESGNSRGQLAPLPAMPPVFTFSGMAFHPDGKRLVAIIAAPATHNSTLAIWDLNSGALAEHFTLVVGQQLDIPPSFIRRPGEAAPTWKATSATQKAVWWGDQHLLLGNKYVVDLQHKQIVARLKHSWVGLADVPLGGQICYTSGTKPHEPGQLTALAVPTQLWQAQLAAQASGQNWLKPGTRVGLNLQLDGPPTDAPLFRDLLTQQLKARFASSGLLSDGAPELTLNMQTRTEDTNVTYRVHSFGGRIGPPQEIKGRRLIANLSLASPQGVAVWQKELRLDPPFSFSAQGQEDFAAAQLNAHWTTVSQEVVNLFPWCMPKDASQKPLPLELTLEPGGVK